jgi:hypothetical protein
MQKLQDMDLRDIEIQRRKTSYQLKNVYLTLTKINTQQIVQPIQYVSANPTFTRDKLKPQISKPKPSLKSSKFETQPTPPRPLL